MWYFYIGAMILKLSGLLAWGLILAGQWRCLMSSSERMGALDYLLLHDVRGYGAGSSHGRLVRRAVDTDPMDRWPTSHTGGELKFTLLGIYVMSVSLITGGLYKLSFWYYLQTIAACMEATKARIFIWLFFVAALWRWPG